MELAQVDFNVVIAGLAIIFLRQSVNGFDRPRFNACRFLLLGYTE